MYEQLKLEKQLCFPLYSLSREITRRYTPFLEALDLTYPQYLVMMVLWEHGQQRVSDIGAKLMLDSGTLTPLLKRLESKALVARARCPRDERSVHIRLTEAGAALQHRAAVVPGQMADAIGLDQSEVLALQKLACKLQAQMQQELE